MGFDVPEYASTLSDEGDILVVPSAEDASGDALVLLPGKTRTFEFSKVAQQKAVVKVRSYALAFFLSQPLTDGNQFTSVKLVLGHEPAAVELRWDVPSWPAPLPLDAQAAMVPRPVISYGHSHSLCSE